MNFNVVRKGNTETVKWIPSQILLNWRLDSSTFDLPASDLQMSCDDVDKMIKTGGLFNINMLSYQYDITIIKIRRETVLFLQ